jgi:hypothetical protein
VPIDECFGHVATFRGSEIIHWHAYARREEALEAVGLRESKARRTRLLTTRGFGRLPSSVADRVGAG